MRKIIIKLLYDLGAKKKEEVFFARLFAALIFMFIVYGCSVPESLFDYHTKVHIADDIEMIYIDSNTLQSKDTVIVTGFYFQRRIHQFVHERRFRERISPYPNPWVENRIVFELEDSTEVKMYILESNKNICDTVFEYRLGRGFIEIKPFYLFSSIASGEYYYNLQFDNENIVKKLDIHRK